VLVQLIAKKTKQMDGTLRYALNLKESLENAGVRTILTLPTLPNQLLKMARTLRKLGLDAEAFFSSYPFRVEVGPSDLFHITSQTLATLLLLQGFQSPGVVTVLDIIPRLTSEAPTLTTMRHGVDRALYALALKGLQKANAVVAISRFTKRTLISHLRLAPERIAVIYPAVNLGLFSPQSVSDSFLRTYDLDDRYRYVLYVGTDDPRKNLSTLLRAFALVHRRVPEARMLKVGASRFGEERARLEALAARLGIKDHVKAVGAVHDRDLVSFYNLADVLVIPSIFEGFGLTAVEAMACGTPVVASDIPALSEVLGDACLTTSPFDTEGLASRILQVMGSNELRDKLASKGLERASRFSLQKQGTALVSLYEQVMTHENRPV